ncbi:NUDIX hydrolase [Candidatus Jorgensenbacteria bacterium]|nr:NUDIX hydrolase [Candidatus Jorgensenbacteria bacterium]
MNAADTQELNQLLKIVVAEGGYLPDQASFEAIQKIVRWPAIEVLIIDPDNPLSFLLTYREDKHWKGWHIPGGYVRPWHESPEATCEAIAKKELKGDFTITKATLIMPPHFWTDHPYGYPISLVYACSVDRRPEISEHAKFFTDIPSPMVPNHDDFVRHYLDVANPFLFKS